MTCFVVQGHTHTHTHIYICTHTLYTILCACVKYILEHDKNCTKIMHLHCNLYTVKLSSFVCHCELNPCFFYLGIFHTLKTSFIWLASFWQEGPNMPAISPYPKPRWFSFYVMLCDSFLWSNVDCSTSLQCALKQMLPVHGLLVHRPRASTKPRFISELCHTWVLRESCPPGAGIHSLWRLQIRPCICVLWKGSRYTLKPLPPRNCYHMKADCFERRAPPGSALCVSAITLAMPDGTC